MIQKLLGRQETTSETLSRKRHEVGVKILQRENELHELQRQEKALTLDRARLLEEQASDEGLDMFEPLRQVDGKLTSIRRRLADLEPRLEVLRHQSEVLNVQIKNAEEAEAPDRMKALLREHGELREAFRTAARELSDLSQAILSKDADIQRLRTTYSLEAPGFLRIEGLATPAHQAAGEWLQKLEWQEAQAALGADMEQKLEEQRQEVARRNAEAGYELYVALGPNFFRTGLIDETQEQRDLRLHG